MTRRQITRFSPRSKRTCATISRSSKSIAPSTSRRSPKPALKRCSRIWPRRSPPDMDESFPIESEEFVEFKCPYCKKTVSFQEEFIGRAQGCPECGETIVVAEKGLEFGKKLPLPIQTDRLILRK